MTELRTPKQATARLQMSAKQLTGFVQNGELRYVDISLRGTRPRRRFIAGDLDAFAAERKAKAVPTCLYRHFDASGTLLYVGVSLHVVVRLIGHRDTAHWFSQLARIEVEHYPTREAALVAEAEAIRTEKPRYNIAGGSA
jgi:hypothetical protein